MSTTDVFSRVSRETTRRRVKFHAGVEDLEGRQLLSAAHFHGFHHVTVHKQPQVHTASVPQTQTANHQSCFWATRANRQPWPGGSRPGCAWPGDENQRSLQGHFGTRDHRPTYHQRQSPVQRAADRERRNVQHRNIVHHFRDDGARLRHTTSKSLLRDRRRPATPPTPTRPSGHRPPPHRLPLTHNSTGGTSTLQTNNTSTTTPPPSSTNRSAIRPRAAQTHRPARRRPREARRDQAVRVHKPARQHRAGAQAGSGSSSAQTGTTTSAGSQAGSGSCECSDGHDHIRQEARPLPEARPRRRPPERPPRPQRAVPRRLSRARPTPAAQASTSTSSSTNSTSDGSGSGTAARRHRPRRPPRPMPAAAAGTSSAQTSTSTNSNTSA